jgi:hypothetical protein
MRSGGAASIARVGIERCENYRKRSHTMMQQRFGYLRTADERGTLLISFTAFVIVGNKNEC